MGSVVVSELINDIHPWSNMIDARAHRADQNPPYDSSYRASPAPSSHRRASSQSSRPSSSTITPTSHPPHAPTSDTPTRTPSGPASAEDAVDLQSSRHISASGASRQDGPPAPPSPRLPPSSTTIRPQTSHRPTSPAAGSASTSMSDEHTSPSSPRAQSTDPGSPQRIKVRDLQHIQSFAGEDMNSYSTSPGTDQGSATPPQYEISDMPISDIIEMLAGLLTKITTTNDQHHDHLHRQMPGPEAAANLSPTTSSVLAFHGKNVPSITILSYLSRIHKYCPATWEVFLSLLVFFDRMTERVNSGPIQSLRQADQEFSERSERSRETSRRPPVATPQSERARPFDVNRASSSTVVQQPSSSQSQQTPSTDSDPCNLAHFFVVDSFNIHRLVIAGVTCAAKYFSDIFFTNSRYAKVGGLPLVELNHLELQFLLLNDFRLAVPVEELEAYATMLVEFYAREVVAQRQNEAMEGIEMVTR